MNKPVNLIRRGCGVILMGAVWGGFMYFSQGKDLRFLGITLLCLIMGIGCFIIHFILKRQADKEEE